MSHGPVDQIMICQMQTHNGCKHNKTEHSTFLHADVHLRSIAIAHYAPV